MLVVLIGVGVAGPACALHVPDSMGNPVWVQLLGEPVEDPGPASGDDDANGLPDWIDTFNWAVATGAITYWSGGTWVVDGVFLSFEGIWMASVTDVDGDQLADEIDLYPNDASNNSYYWTGGTFTFNGIMHHFRPDWHAGSGADLNENLLPDTLEGWFDDPSSHGTLQYWGGGTFMINGEYSTFEPVNYYASSVVDTDSDGIPDELDINPSDAWNNSSYSWVGGEYPIDGVITNFSPLTLGGVWEDSDDDGIPNPADPHPNDGNNNSAWWQGGSFYINGQLVEFAATFHRADATDTDGDGIPDDLDPYPSESSNYASYDWPGGVFYINNQYQEFSASTYQGTWSDGDGDGIPDPADPYPYDSNNANVTESFYWPGGVFTIDNTTVTFEGGDYPGSWNDTDSDGIPDAVDPYPSDSSNGCNYFYWQGGEFLIGGQYVSFAEGTYDGAWSDSDGDGVPDSLDAYPYDSNNGNDNYYWSGGSYRVDNQDVYYEGTTIQGSWSDADGDGIPDPADPYPWDSQNGNSSSTSTTWWAGGTFQIDNQYYTYPSGDFEGSWSDQDEDSIPDVFDPYPWDSNNGNNIFYWEGGTFTIDNSSWYFAPGTRPGAWSDSDGDGIPDSEDPYPYDSNNQNSSFYWSGGTYLIDNSDVYFSPGYYSGDGSDSDWDSIPDAADPYPGDSSNGNSSQFYWDGGYFTINDNTEYFSSGWYEGSWTDEDNDMIPGSLDPYPWDSNNGNTNWPPPTFWWSGGTYYVDGSEVYWPEGEYAGAWEDSDNDGIPDSLDIHPHDATNNSEEWPGGEFMIEGQLQLLTARWHRTNCPDFDGDEIPDDCDPYPEDPTNRDGYMWPSVVTSFMFNNSSLTFEPAFYVGQWLDTDEDTVPDVADPMPDDAFNGNDSDADGLPDSVEALYPGVLSASDPLDAQSLRRDAVTQEEDGLTYLQAYLYAEQFSVQPNGVQLRLDQLLSPALDSDNDRMSDLYEARWGLSAFDPGDAMQCHSGDYILNVEKEELGLPLLVAISESEYETITGVTRSFVTSNHDGSLSVAENDWDDDGVSNLDEVMVFYTNCRDAGSRPTNATILSKLLTPQGVSQTTWLNFHHLLNPPPLPANSGLDSDGDGLSDELEAWINQQFEAGLDMYSWDSNGDGIPDGMQFTSEGTEISDVAGVGFVRPLANEANY